MLTAYNRHFFCIGYLTTAPIETDTTQSMMEYLRTFSTDKFCRPIFWLFF